jgi:hypothetical protein
MTFLILERPFISVVSLKVKYLSPRWQPPSVIDKNLGLAVLGQHICPGIWWDALARDAIGTNINRPDGSRYYTIEQLYPIQRRGRMPY